jgi:hypothetical protein
VNFTALLALVEKPPRQIVFKEEFIGSSVFIDEFREVALGACWC